jgi:hypothetical protein
MLGDEVWIEEDEKTEKRERKRGERIKKGRKPSR